MKSNLKLIGKLAVLVGFFIPTICAAQNFNYENNVVESATITGERYKQYLLSGNPNNMANQYIFNSASAQNPGPQIFTNPCGWDASVINLFSTSPDIAGQDITQALIPSNVLNNNIAIKERRAFVKIAVNHDFSIPIGSGVQIAKSRPYVYKFYFKVRLFTSSSDPAQNTELTDSLMISYLPDGTYAYQDIALKTYPNAYSIQVQLLDVFDVTNYYYNGGVPINPTTTYNASGVGALVGSGTIVHYEQGWRYYLDNTPSVSAPLLATNWTLDAGVEFQKFTKVMPGGSPATVYNETLNSLDNTMQNVTPSTYCEFDLAVDNVLKVGWNPFPINNSESPEPIMYELEWTYVDNYKVDITNGVFSLSEKPKVDLYYDFNADATRIITNKTSYNIPLIYKQGYLVFRVRFIRPKLNGYKEYLYSPWSLPNAQQSVNALSHIDLTNATSQPVTTSCVKIISPHVTDDINWNYQVSFAEEGKNKNVVSYFDGLLKNRQSVTKFTNLPNQLIATQPLYNFEGSVGLQTLPIPIIKSPSTDHSLTYQPNFISGINKSDYDTPTPNYANLQLTSSNPSLARIYYSVDNPLLTNSNDRIAKAIPDAEGYPFIQTLYAKDDPSRIRIQGGAGEALQIGKNHETKFYYSDPIQSEVDQYLGLQAGRGEFYEKTITRDPNHQLSFSVSNNKGKPVITGLMQKFTPSTDPLYPFLPVDHVDGSTETNLVNNMFAASKPYWEGFTLKHNKTIFNESGLMNLTPGYSLPVFKSCSTGVNTYAFNFTTLPQFTLNLKAQDETGLAANSVDFVHTGTSLIPTPQNPTNPFGIGDVVSDLQIRYDPSEIENQVNIALQPMYDNPNNINPPPCITSYPALLSTELSALEDKCAYFTDAETNTECGTFRNMLEMQVTPGNAYAEYLKLGINGTIIGNSISYFRIIEWRNATGNTLSNQSLGLTSNGNFDDNLCLENNVFPTIDLANFGSQDVVTYLTGLKNMLAGTYSALNAYVPPTGISASEDATRARLNSELHKAWSNFLDGLSSYAKPVCWFQNQPSIPVMSAYDISATPLITPDMVISNFNNYLNDFIQIHPEYCIYYRMYCDDVTGTEFTKKLESISTFAEAEKLGYQTIGNLANEDPARIWFDSWFPTNISPYDVSTPAIQSTTNLNMHATFIPNLKIDEIPYHPIVNNEPDWDNPATISLPISEFAMYLVKAKNLSAYQAAFLFKDMKDFAANQTSSAFNAYVNAQPSDIKDQYFDMLRTLYLKVRRHVTLKRFSDFPDCQKTCSFVQTKYKIYRQMFNSTGEIDASGTGYANLVNTLYSQYINGLPTSFNNVESLYTGYVDHIIKQLSNCQMISTALANETSPPSGTNPIFPSVYYSFPTPTSVLGWLKNDLLAWCSMNFDKPVSRFWSYGITPELIKNLLVSRGIQANDLCNEWLISYEQTANTLNNSSICDFNDEWFDLSNGTDAKLSAIHESAVDVYSILKTTTSTSGSTVQSANRVLNASIYSASTSLLGNAIDDFLMQEFDLQGSNLTNITYTATLDHIQSSNLAPNVQTPALTYATQINSSLNNIFPLKLEGSLNYGSKSLEIKFISEPNFRFNGYYEGDPDPQPNLPTMPFRFPYVLSWEQENTTDIETKKILLHILKEDPIPFSAPSVNYSVPVSILNSTNDKNNGYFYFVQCKGESTARTTVFDVLYIKREYFTTSSQDKYGALIWKFKLYIENTSQQAEEQCCITAYMMKNGMENFNGNVRQTYNIFGPQHPYYEDVLVNYHNFNFRKNYPFDEYKKLLIGCDMSAYTSFMMEYFSYFQAHGSSTYIDNVLNLFFNYAPINAQPNYKPFRNIEYAHYKENSTGDEHLYIDFTSIKHISGLRKFLLHMVSSLQGVSGGNYAINQLEANPNTNFCYVLHNKYPAALDAGIAALSAYSVTVSSGSSSTQQNSPTFVRKYRNEQNVETQMVYYLTKFEINPASTQKDKRRAIYEIEKLFLNSDDLAYTLLKSVQTTYSDDNAQSNKQKYLTYAYNITNTYANPTPTEIQNWVKKDNAAPLLNDPLYDNVTYFNPLRVEPTALDNAHHLSGTLYLSNNATITYGKQFLTNILNNVNRNAVNITQSNNSCINSSAKFFDKSSYNSPNFAVNNYSISTINGYNGTTTIYPKRQAENIYWFKVKQVATGGIVTLKNIYIKVPDMYTVADLSHFAPIMSSLEVISTMQGTTAFKIIFSTGIGGCTPTNTEFTAYGRTDFNLIETDPGPEVYEYVMLCDDEQYNELFNPCMDEAIDNAKLLALQKYTTNLDDLKQSLITDYHQHIKNNLAATYTMQIRQQKYAMTVYGYDRAGNLIYTVPPAGMPASFNQTQIDAMTASRANNTWSANSGLLPDYKKKSVYKYNSINQLTTQSTPDGGETKFYYDPSGKLVFSQNAKQAPKNQYSYTLYDDLNRIIETGEIVLNPKCPKIPNPNISCDEDELIVLIQNLASYTYYNNLLNGCNKFIREKVWTRTRTEVVRTIYDEPFYNFVANTNNLSEQEFLRSRVAAIINYPAIAPNIVNPTTGYQVALHYSYDMSGNVNTMTYDMPELAYIKQQYKRIDYDYDLYSGKVNLVSYNRGFTDQFYQRYDYDADNRITKVETSQDGLLWDNDAEYTYYPHGPLARIRLGELAVQGIDFAYTLQGWLKSINGDQRNPIKDIGCDGIAAGDNPLKDELSHTLYYYTGDYKPINATDQTNASSSTRTLTDNIPSIRSLYNGNISATVTAPGKFENLMTEYWYDQLNRLKKAEYKFPDYAATSNDYNDVFKKLTSFTCGNAPLSTSANYSTISNDDIYKSEYQYDLDGNIEKLVRFGAYIVGNQSNNQPNHIVGNALANAFVMDDLNYKYNFTSSNPDNKLDDYEDKVANHYGTTTFSNDLQEHLTANSNSPRFTYDPIGNLVQDLTNPKNMSTITWSLYGKVKNIEYDNQTLTSFGYEPTGNRFKKSNTKDPNTAGQLRNNEYYIRDASGNILAIYKHHLEYEYGIPMVEVLNNLDGFPEFYPTLGGILAGNQEFANQYYQEILLSSQGHLANRLAQETPDYYAKHNRDIAQQVVSNYSPFITQMAQANKLPEVVSYLSPSDLVEMMYPLVNIANDSERLEYLKIIVPEDSTTLRAAMVDVFGVTSSPYADFLNEINFYTVNLGDTYFAELMSYAYEIDSTYFAPLALRLINSSEYRNLPSTEGNKTFAELTANRYGNLAPLDDVAAYIQAHQTEPALLVLFHSIAREADKYNTMMSVEPEQVFLHMKANHTGYKQDIADALESLESLNLGTLIHKMSLEPALDNAVNLLYSLIVKKEKFYLAEHHIYGSSRLGIKKYWPNHYYFFYEQNDPNMPDWQTALATNELISLRKPWYSHKLNTMIKANQTKPFYNPNHDRMLSTRILGQKSYELTNHLGNVMAVVSDKPEDKVENFDPLTTALPAACTQLPALKASYDYYPFGMLMPLRYEEDSTIQCLPITKTVYTPVYENEGEYVFHDHTLNSSFGTATEINGTLYVDNQNNQSKFTSTNNETLSKLIMPVAATIESGKEYLLTASLSNYASSSISIAIEQQDSASVYQPVTTTTLNSEGIVYISAKATNNNLMRIVFSGTAADFSIFDITYTRVDVLASTVTEQVCSNDEDFDENYRFGFNGMHKDNEIKGTGNSLDFGARIYDSRLGRWLSLDPEMKKYPSWSAYNGMNDCPISVVDKTGKGGELIFENGVITLYMEIQVYTNEPSHDNHLGSALAIMQAKQINAQNNSSLQMRGPDGNMYPLKIVATAIAVSEKDAFNNAKNNVGDNYNPRLNFSRVEDFTKHEGLNEAKFSAKNSLAMAFSDDNKTRSKLASVSGDNSVLTDYGHINTTSYPHEIFVHSLGNRGKYSHISSVEPDAVAPFPLGVVTTTTGVNNLYTTESPDGNGCVIDQGYRQLMQEDVNCFTVGKWTKGADGTYRANVGNSTNTYFTSNGKEVDTQKTTYENCEQ